jgi:hypothetical protein
VTGSPREPSSQPGIEVKCHYPASLFCHITCAKG